MFQDECDALLEALTATLDPVPQWLQGRPLVYAATGKNSMFKLCCDILSKQEQNEVVGFNLAQATVALAYCVGKNDAELRLRSELSLVQR